MNQALQLLIMAMQLLTVVSTANVPTAFKDQAIQVANYAIQVAQDELKKTPETITASSTPINELEFKGVTLKNSLGIEYEFTEPMINQQRIRDLLGVGFTIIKGSLPEGFLTKTAIPPVVLNPMASPK